MTKSDIDSIKEGRYMDSPRLNTISDQNALWQAIADGVVAVSYTHLRAHET